MKDVRIYKKATGEEPFINWINHVKDKVMKARIYRRLDRLYFGNEGDFKSVGKGVFELRLAFGSGYRIYYGKKGDDFILLLVGGDKSSQTKDIKLAQKYWADFSGSERYER